MKKNIVIVLITLTILAITSCETTKNKKATIDYLLVNPNPVTINRGSILDFTAIAHGANNPPQTVTWNVDGNSSFSTSINNNGQLTVAEDESSDVMTVRATSTYDRNKNAIATVFMFDPVVNAVIVTPNLVDVGIGWSHDFVATVTGSNNPPQTVTWSITGNNSSYTTINSNGRLSVLSGESSTEITVIATSTVDTTKSGSATANIVVPTVSSVVVSPNNVSVLQGTSQQFLATVNGQYSPPQWVTWSISGNNSLNTKINSTGRLTVDVDETSSLINIIATSNYNTTYSGSAISHIIEGDFINFGGYSWRILNRVANNRVLVISAEIIELKPYHNSYDNITWEHCSLREYLNGEFYDSFSATDRARIREVTNLNPKNPDFTSSVGGNPTLDKIFLLSIPEAQQYFSSDADRITTHDGWISGWGMRSPGQGNNLVSYVNNSGVLNLLGVWNNYNNFGVRPAMWLNLE